MQFVFPYILSSIKFHIIGGHMLASYYSVNSFIANVICYITIPSLNKVLYLVSYNLIMF